MLTLIVDALASGRGWRASARDAIGAGPRAIAGVLERHGLECRIARAEEALRERRLLMNAGVILASAMTMDIEALRRLSYAVKLKSPETPMVAGGPAASDPYALLSRTLFDIAVIGEGEKTLEELLSIGLSRGAIPDPDDLKSVRGLAYRWRGRVVVTEQRPLMSGGELDSYRPSVRRVADYPHYFAARVYVEVVRGCSNFKRTSLKLRSGLECTGCNRCSSGSLAERLSCPAGIRPGCGYCSVPSLHGPPRSRSIESITSEVRELIALGVHRIVLSAPDFLDYMREKLVEPEPLTDPRSPEPNYSAIEELLASLRSIAEESGAYIMVENIKPSLFTERAARILAEYLPGTPVHIGCETGDPAHSRMLGRPSAPSEALEAARRAARHGLRPYVYFIHGLPAQTRETVERTVELIEKLDEAGVEKVTVYRFKPLPMSAFEHEPPGRPASRDPLSYRIVEAARQLNTRRKMRLVGKRMKVIVAEPHPRHRRYAYAYPLEDGPAVLLVDGAAMIASVVEAKVTRVLSDRLVEAEVSGS